MRTPDEGAIGIALSITTGVRFIHVNGVYAIAPARVEARSARPYHMRSHLVNEEMSRQLRYSDLFGLDGLEPRFTITGWSKA